MNYILFLKQNKEKFLFAALLLFVFIFILSNLTTRPKLWFDEGVNIELSRNFLLFKKLDILTAPGEFTGYPYIVGTNGYPLTIPLAGFFKFFGFGLKQTRIYMMIWIFAVLFSFFYIIKSIFNDTAALSATAFLSFFSPLYASGMTATGECPGLFFLLWGLYFLIKYENHFACGLFFALAAASKPSLYLLLFPSYFLFLIIKEKQNIFLKLIKFSFGAFIPIFLWMFLIIPDWFLKETWFNLLNFYKNPFSFSNESIFQNIIKNLSLFPFHTTLLYFSFISFIAAFAFYKSRRGADLRQKKIFIFIFIYGVLSLFYFLKSPGWFRYLFAYETLVLALVFPSISIIGEKIFKSEKKQNIFFFTAVIFFLSLQIINLFFLRETPVSSGPETAAKFLNSEITKDKNYKVGIFSIPAVAALIPPDSKYHIVQTTEGFKPFGKNPLSFQKEFLPEFIVARGESKFISDYKNVLEENYARINVTDDFRIYKLK